MRIVHFLLGRCNPDSANGVEKTVYYMSKTMASLGHRVSVLCLTKKPSLFIEGVSVKSFQPSRNPFTLPQDLLVEIRGEQPDVVHFHSSYIPQNISLARYLRKQGIPYVVTPNGGLSPFVLRRRTYLKLPFKYFFERAYLGRASFVHAVHEREVEEIRKYGVHNEIIVAPHAVEFDVLGETDSRSLERSYPQVHGKRVFMFIGRLDPVHKGLDLLLDAFRLGDKGLANAILVLAGPDWRGSRGRLEKMSRRLNITSQVIFTGPVYEKAKFDLLSGADVFIHTSRWEVFGFAILEALSLGKPCLVTNSVNLSTYIRHYRAGFVAELNAYSIAECLKHAMSLDHEELRAMGQRGRTLAKSAFNWLKTVEKLISAYSQGRKSVCSSTH